MPWRFTNLRWPAPNGASFTNTVGGMLGCPSSARCARPVVPVCRSSTVTDVTSASIASDIHSGVRSSTSIGSGDMRRDYAVPSAAVSTRRNRKIVLARRPSGAVSADCFAATEEDVPALGDGEALLEVRYLGTDPTIRGRLDERGNY